MKRILLILSIITIFINGGQQVYASSKFDETFFNLNDIVYYDATETCSNQSSTTSLSGVDNAEKIWNYLKGKGFTDESIAGILGNAEVESGVNPKKYESDYIEKIANKHDLMKNKPTVEGLGIDWNYWQMNIYNGAALDKDFYFHAGEHYIGTGFLQWTGPRAYNLAKKAQEINADVWDLGFQLDYLTQYENTYASWVSSEYKNFKGTPEEATVVFLNKWIVNSLGNRAVAARQYYDKFKGSGGGSGNVTSSVTNSYTFIGDSITVGVKSQLESSFTGSNVKAEVGQGVDWAVSQLSDIKDTVVINLGTNDRFTNGKNLLEKLKDKKVYLVDIYGTGGNADFETTNKNIESIAKEFSNVQVLSWKKYLDENGGRDKYYAQEAGGANYHLNEEGKTLYIKFLKEKLSGESSSNTSGSCGSSQFSSSGDATRQTPDGFSIFLQTDPRWKDIVYHEGAGFTIGYAGCGPTSFTMIANALGTKVGPEEVAKKAVELGVVVPGAGAAHSQALELAKHYNLQSEMIDHKSINDINKHLDQGHLIWMGGQGVEPPFTSGGHLVVVRKKLPNGKWLIANPFAKSEEEDMKEWDPSYVVTYSNTATAVWK